MDTDRPLGSPTVTHDYGPGWLTKIFAHFQPLVRAIEKSVTRSHPAGDMPSSRTLASADLPELLPHEKMKRFINMDSYENFSQLMFSASLVRVGPANGVFNALVEVIEKQTIRIFRDWLTEQASIYEAEFISRAMSGHLASGTYETSGGTIWLNDAETASFEARVEQLCWQRGAPISEAGEEEEQATFSLEIESEFIPAKVSSLLTIPELRIGLVHLLLALERKSLATDNDGKAMVIGSFPTANG